MLIPLISALLAGAVASPVGQPAAKLEGRQSSVATGSVITACTVSNTFALTFDDGPYEYTDTLLDTLSAAGIKATFFLNGKNFGTITDYTSTVQRMISDGHQVGSHTYSHADLATLDADGITSEMTELETILLSMIGKVPTYMRPPYFSTNALALQTLGSLGYHVINANIDTQDYEHDDDTIDVAVQNFESGLASGGTISLEHDVHQHTVETLVPAAITAIKAKGLTAVSVGECLGDAEANWYKTDLSAAAVNTTSNVASAPRPGRR